VTEDRFTDELGDADALDAADEDELEELLDEEQAAAARPVRAITETAKSLRLEFINILYFDSFYWDSVAPRSGVSRFPA
jgi:hypothetical protein